MNQAEAAKALVSEELAIPGARDSAIQQIGRGLPERQRQVSEILGKFDGSTEQRVVPMETQFEIVLRLLR